MARGQLHPISRPTSSAFTAGMVIPARWRHRCTMLASGMSLLVTGILPIVNVLGSITPPPPSKLDTWSPVTTLLLTSTPSCSTVVSVSAISSPLNFNFSAREVVMNVAELPLSRKAKVWLFLPFRPVTITGRMDMTVLVRSVLVPPHTSPFGADGRPALSPSSWSCWSACRRVGCRPPHFPHVFRLLHCLELCPGLRHPKHWPLFLISSSLSLMPRFSIS